MRALFLASTLSLLAGGAIAETPNVTSDASGKTAEVVQLGLSGSTVVLPDDLWMNMGGEINPERSTVTIGEKLTQCDLLMKPGIEMEDAVHALDHAVSRSEVWAINLNGFSPKGDYFLLAESPNWTGTFGISTGLHSPMKLKCVLTPASTPGQIAPEAGGR